jgi:hypothetical protein
LISVRRSECAEYAENDLSLNNDIKNGVREIAVIMLTPVMTESVVADTGFILTPKYGERMYSREITTYVRYAASNVTRTI